jgi:hypothetical protein
MGGQQTEVALIRGVPPETASGREAQIEGALGVLLTRGSGENLLVLLIGVHTHSPGILPYGVLH